MFPIIRSETQMNQEPMGWRASFRYFLFCLFYLDRFLSAFTRLYYWYYCVSRHSLSSDCNTYQLFLHLVTSSIKGSDPVLTTLLIMAHHNDLITTGTRVDLPRSYFNVYVYLGTYASETFKKNSYFNVNPDFRSP